jgi:hypothetical protein
MWNKPHLLNAIADLLMLAAAAALLAAAAVWLVRVPSLPVRHVVFAEELPHTKRGEVEQVLPQALKGNFFSLNLEAVRGALEKLPWVRKVELRRAMAGPAGNQHRGARRCALGRGARRAGQQLRRGLRGDCCRGRVERLPLLYGPQGTAPEVLKRYGEFIGSFQGGRRKAGAGDAVAAPGLAVEAGERHVGRYRARAAEVAGRRAAGALYRGLSGNGRQTCDATGSGGFAVSEWLSRCESRAKAKGK